MEAAYNYYDFVQILNHKACNEEVSELTAYFATYHASIVSDFNCLERIAQKYGDLTIIRPHLFFASAYQGREADIEKTREAVDEVLKSNPPKWLELEMLLIKFEAESFVYPKCLFDSTTLDRIMGLLKPNSQFRFYEARLHDLLAIRASRDGDTDELIQNIESAASIAEEYNDENRLARILRTKAVHIQSSDLKASLELLLQSLDMLKSMGDKDGLSYTIFQLSKIEAIRGEYDQAIEHNLENITLRQSLGKPIGPYAITLSTLFNSIGNAEAGLEWAKMAEVEFQPVHKPRAILNQAWALCLMQDISGATELVDEVRENILKSGLESHLAALYLIDGIIELEKNNFLQAQASLEEALDIYNRRGTLMSEYICLHHLAKSEVLLAGSSQFADTSKGLGPWLTLLEERAQSNDLPGILGQALFYKTQWYLFQEKYNEGKGVLKQLRVIIQENNLNYLERIIKRLEGV